MAKSMLRWSPTDPKPSPNECLSIEHPNVIQIALLQGSTLLAPTRSLHMLLIEVETPMDDQI